VDAFNYFSDNDLSTQPSDDDDEYLPCPE
jgi:hypothetical protein